jgi:hypothetical protein
MLPDVDAEFPERVNTVALSATAMALEVELASVKLRLLEAVAPV